MKMYTVVYFFSGHSVDKHRQTFLSGFWISGRTAQNGFTNSKNFTEINTNNKQYCMPINDNIK